MNHRAAIVTGGAVRIGQRISLCLAEMGYDIVLHYGKSVEEARRTRLLIEKMGVRCQMIAMDLSEIDTGPRLFDLIDPDFRIEILVNNAAIFKPSGFEGESTEWLDQHYRINF